MRRDAPHSIPRDALHSVLVDSARSGAPDRAESTTRGTWRTPTPWPALGESWHTASVTRTCLVEETL